MVTTVFWAALGTFGVLLCGWVLIEVWKEGRLQRRVQRDREAEHLLTRLDRIARSKPQPWKHPR
jgi:hypothetical protein